MTIQSILKNLNMSIYKLAKTSGLPYATVNDICNGKARLEKCSAETVYKIARALDVSMEDLLEQRVMNRSNFENFKSTVCHRVKELGDIEFIVNILESQEIRIFFEQEWLPESLYLLAMLDYLSRENGVPFDTEYDDIRQYRLEKPVYPSSLLAMAAAAGDDKVLTNARNNAIPEFARFNIIEDEIRNVV